LSIKAIALALVLTFNYIQASLLGILITFVNNFHFNLVVMFVCVVKINFSNKIDLFYHTLYFKDPLIFNDKRLLAPKYSGAASLEVLHPFLFLDPVL
jgi:hypothetical protein